MVIYPGELGNGNVYFVDPSNGDDDNSGVSANNAKKTMQAAVDLCTDWNGDHIVRLKGNETVTTPVLFNKQGITVRIQSFGMPLESAGERFMTYGSHTDGPAAIVSAPCKLVGLGFCGSEAAGGSLEIDGETGGFSGGNFVELNSCRFSHWGVAKAFALILQGTGDVWVDSCYFDGYTAGYTTAAIQCELAGTSGTWVTRIINNTFININTYAIKMATGAVPVRGIVKGNTVIGAGKFFDDNNVTGSFGFYDNWLPTATDATSYGDTVANLKIAGYKFAGNHYSE